MRLELSKDQGRVLGSELIQLRREIDSLELRWSTLAAAFTATGHHVVDGSATAVDWLRHNCQMGRGAVSDRIAVGNQLDKLEGSVLALHEAELGFGHLTLLARTAEAVKDKFHEPDLLDQAREQSVGRFHFTCENYRHACDPEAVAEAAESLYEQRELTMRRRRDGLVTIWGRLDPVGAAIIRNTLKPLARRQGKEDRRTFKQRLHDAAVEQACAGRHAHVNVTIAAETLLGMPGAPAGQIEQVPPVSIKTIERLTCDCTIRRIVRDPKSVVIEVGRARRIVSPAERKALEARDKTCVWTGCDRPASQCHSHHLVHWARGGTNELENQALLCAFHHRLVHEGGWQIVRLADGQIVVLRPPPTFPTRARGPDDQVA
jgi:hypothetical protein